MHASDQNEWENLVTVLSQLQWQRNPPNETLPLVKTLFDQSQGIVSIAVRLALAS
jgi:hypothetical protein